MRVGVHSATSLSATADRPAPVHDEPQGRRHLHDRRRAPCGSLRRWPVGDLVGSVSPDGRLFALGSEGGEVRLLDLRSGRIRPFHGRHAAAVRRMRFTPDGRTLVTSGARRRGDRLGRRRAARSARRFSGTPAGTSGDWTCPRTGGRCTAQHSMRAPSCGTSPAIGGSTGRSSPACRSSPTTATGIRSSSRSPRTGARSP